MRSTIWICTCIIMVACVSVQPPDRTVGKVYVRGTGVLNGLLGMDVARICSVDSKSLPKCESSIEFLSGERTLELKSASKPNQRYTITHKFGAGEVYAHVSVYSLKHGGMVPGLKLEKHVARKITRNESVMLEAVPIR